MTISCNLATAAEAEVPKSVFSAAKLCGGTSTSGSQVSCALLSIGADSAVFVGGCSASRFSLDVSGSLRRPGSLLPIFPQVPVSLTAGSASR